jgi:hypothetical protein
VPSKMTWKKVSQHVDCWYREFRGRILTDVPSFRSDRSSVVPDGTATFDSTMVAQEPCDLDAEDAPLEPENVQLPERFVTSPATGAGVGRGLASVVATKSQRNEVVCNIME